VTTLNHYTTGGVEKHSDSSFTLFGYIENKETGEDVAGHKMRYMGYSLKNAKEMFKSNLEFLAEDLERLEIFDSHTFKTCLFEQPRIFNISSNSLFDV
jgi:hypothetical protein